MKLKLFEPLNTNEIYIRYKNNKFIKKNQNEIAQPL